MSADTLWTLTVAAIIALFVGCVVVGILGNGTREIERQDRNALTQQAADFNEPTREDIEWDMWVDEALRMSETPIHDQVAIDRLHAELNNEAAVVLWLRGAL